MCRTPSVCALEDENRKLKKLQRACELIVSFGVDAARQFSVRRLALERDSGALLAALDQLA